MCFVSVFVVFFFLCGFLFPLLSPSLIVQELSVSYEKHIVSQAAAARRSPSLLQVEWVLYLSKNEE